MPTGIWPISSGVRPLAEARPNDAATRYNHAMLLGKTQRYHDAQRELEASRRADPGCADAYALLGDLLMARNQALAAASHYREAVRLGPESVRASFGLGWRRPPPATVEAIPLLAQGGGRTGRGSVSAR